MKEKTIILLETRGCDFSLTKEDHPTYIDLTPEEAHAPVLPYPSL